MFISFFTHIYEFIELIDTIVTMVNSISWASSILTHFHTYSTPIMDTGYLRTHKGKGH